MGNLFRKRKHISTAKGFSIPEPPPLMKGSTFVALYDYISKKETDLSFKANDLLTVVVKPSETWWLAQHQISLKRGYVPHNFIAEYNNCHTITPGWCDITRIECEQRLNKNSNVTGTYLIRPSSDNRYLVLSVRCLDENRQVLIKHHRITFKIQEYFIEKRRTFLSLRDLISHYQIFPGNSDGLLCRLTNPLPANEKHLTFQFRDIEIKREDIKMIKKIGRGHFGEVYMAQLYDTMVAVKLLTTETGDKKKILKEGKVMHQLHHQRIVELIGVCTSPSTEPILLITELMENGSLLEYLKSPQSASVTYYTMLIMLMEITEGMAYLESKSYIHRDLRTANILVGSDYSVKVADFGLAGIVEEMYIYVEQGFTFPIRWVAVEALLTNKFTLKSDVWSFGILMTEIITFGRTPYKELETGQVSTKVKNGYRIKRPTSLKVQCPDNYFEIMESCWRKHRERPSFKFLHSTFKDLVNQYDHTSRTSSRTSLTEECSDH